MAVFGKVDDCLVPRGAFDNDFFRWLKKPKGIQKRHLDIADVGSLASSPMANVLAGKPKESSQAAVRSRFRDGGGDVTIVQQFLRALSMLCPYTIYRLLRISLMHLRGRTPGSRTECLMSTRLKIFAKDLFS